MDEHGNWGIHVGPAQDVLIDAATREHRLRDWVAVIIAEPLQVSHASLTNRLYTAAVSMDALLLLLPLLLLRLGEKHSVQRSSSMLLLPAGVCAGW
jgi:hypothetical protein